MNLDYPANPTYGQTYKSGSFTWMWDGQKWASGLGAPVTSVAGRTGDVVLTHSDITDWNTYTQFLPLSGGQLSGGLQINNGGLAAGRALPANANALSILGGSLTMSGPTALFNNVYNDTSGASHLLANAPCTAINNTGGVFGFFTAPAAAVNSSPAWTQILTVQNNDPGMSTGPMVITNRKIRFQTNAGDEGSAGSIDYRGYDGGCMSLVGAGGSPRYVRIFDRLMIGGITEFDDGNCHIEGNSTLWLNGNTGQPVRAGGELYVGSNLWVNGNYWQNNGGMYTNANVNCNDFYSRNNINCAGILYMQGGSWYWTNDGGWMTCNPPLYSYSDIAAAGAIRCGGRGGPYWSNNSGIWTDSTTRSNGTLPRWDQDGSSGLSGTAWSQCAAYWFNQQSDVRLKQDIEKPPAGALDAVLALSPVQFRYRRQKPPPPVEEAKDYVDDVLGRDVTDMSDEPLRRGFLAHEVRAVLGSEFGGWREENGIEGLSYADLTAVLWQAVQELTARLAAMEARAHYWR